MNQDWARKEIKPGVRRFTLRKGVLDRTIWAHRSRKFSTDEDGSTVVLSLFVLIIMFVMAGLGIDTMRYEMERTHLQATLDSAVLASAGAPVGSEVNEVKEIVEDYFAKNDMSQYLHEIDTDGQGEDDIETSLNATRVYAEASMDMDTYLMQLSGVDQLTAFGAAEAEVRTPKLEISVVLDVSGSMGGSKIANLKAAAKSFVTAILNNSEPGNTVISLVPFSWNVTPGIEIFDSLTVTETHDYSTCLRFNASDYNSAALDPDVAYSQQIYTSVYGAFDNLSEGWRSCFPEERAEILPYSMSETALHNHIDSLDADGNTSGHIGMKWGAALLDAAFQGVVGHLQDANIVDPSLDNIPSVYGEAETLKVIVMMADGKNTTSYYFDEDSPYRGPNSKLYLLKWQNMVFQYAYRKKKKGGTKISYDESKCSNSKWTCIYEAGDEEFSAYYLEDDGWYYDIEGEGPVDDSDNWLSNTQFQDIQTDPGFVSLERLSWEQAWGFMSPEWYGSITDDWGAWNDYVNSEYENGSTKNTRMRAICSATKSQGVIVYTIGFEISPGGTAETELQACASSANHYYPTNGANISAAFSSIASNVQNLRLTQ